MAFSNLSKENKRVVPLALPSIKSTGTVRFLQIISQLSRSLSIRMQILKKKRILALLILN